MWLLFKAMWEALMKLRVALLVAVWLAATLLGILAFALARLLGASPGAALTLDLLVAVGASFSFTWLALEATE